jgi:NhaP-type Na+/H+ or K+/H+ antiporter
MTVTWVVFENFLTVDKNDLEYLRETRLPVHGHAYTALLFPFVGILLGASIQWLISKIGGWRIPCLPEYTLEIPYTVVLMLIGGLLDVLCSIPLPGYNSMQQSVDMWASMDGHLLLYAFLPALLFGDAMAFDVHTFIGSFSQCLLLACPGVLLGTGLTAICARFLLQWSWGLSFVFGSIMAATDPVAVVALLKAVGASPTLTMQITGESLLNDGTAIVIFNICCGMYGIGPERSYGQMGIYFFMMAIIGPLLGYFFGFVAYYWGLKRASRKHDEADVVIQVAITVSTAYLSFFVAESEVGVSGVLCTVMAAIYLAQHSWPVMLSHESMESCWHLIEFIGNTLIFLLAGVITSRVLVKHSGQLHKVLGMWLVLVIIRAVMILVFYPLLRQLGLGTTPKDSAFMVWAGLRGAVGLALAVFVADQAPDEEEGEILIVFVSGLALTTLVFNGTTAELFLKHFKMVGIRGSELSMLEDVRLRVKQNAEHVYHEACVEMKHNAAEALAPLEHLGEELRHLLEDDGKAIEIKAEDELEDEMDHMADVETIHHHHKEHSIAGFYKEASLRKLLRELMQRDTGVLDENMVQSLRKEYYGLVRAHYWEVSLGVRVGVLFDRLLYCLRAELNRTLSCLQLQMIEGGHLPRKSPAVHILLFSIEHALDDISMPLHDWDTLELQLRKEDGPLERYIFPTLDKMLCDFVTFDNVILYWLTENRIETQFYILHGYVHATKHAQHNLTEFFGASEFLQNQPEKAEEIKVLLESAINFKHATEWADSMKRMKGNMVHRIKSHIIAKNVLDEQVEFVCGLIKEGVLSQTAAKEIFNELEKDKHALERARWSAATKYVAENTQTMNGKVKRMESRAILKLASSSHLDNTPRRRSMASVLAKSGFGKVLGGGESESEAPKARSAAGLWHKMREKRHLLAHKEALLNGTAVNGTAVNGVTSSPRSPSSSPGAVHAKVSPLSPAGGEEQAGSVDETWTLDSP